MKLYLVRHGRAEPRASSDADDLLRPLALIGLEQARALADHLEQDPPRRILCGPSLRCQQTVEPLAVARGIPVEVDERLARGESADRAVELLPTWDDGPLLLCTHADIIGSLLHFLELVDVDPPDCRKGSVWVLEGRGCTPTRASYFEPARRSRRKALALREAPRPRNVRAAVLDLGSTSCTLLIADVRRSGAINPVVREKVMLRLGSVIGDEAGIPAAMQRRVLAVVRALSEVVEREKVQRFLPVATASLRDARNGERVAQRLAQLLGRPVRILSGEEEARLMFRAFQARLDLGRQPVLGLDLGGGSLELAVGSGRRLMHEWTLALGVVRLHSEHVARDPMRRSEVAAIRGRVQAALAPHREAIRAHAVAAGGTLPAIASGGTARALFRLVQERRAGRGRREVRAWLSRKRLAALEGDLVRSSHAQRLRMRGMRKARADLLPTGAIVLHTLARELDLDGFRVCDWGLREGVLLDALGPEGGVPSRAPGAPCDGSS